MKTYFLISICFVATVFIYDLFNDFDSWTFVWLLNLLINVLGFIKEARKTK